MAIALSQDDYWALIGESAADEHSASTADQVDITWNYPSQLGHGFVREIRLREGLLLAIANYQLHSDVITNSADCEHPLEYTFNVSTSHPPPIVFTAAASHREIAGNRVQINRLSGSVST